jgi:hypothetical protein
MKQDLFSNLKLRRNDSNISTGDRAVIPVPSRPEMLCAGRKEGKTDMKDNQKDRS